MTMFKDMSNAARMGWLAWCDAHDWGGEHQAWYDDMTGEVVTYGAETSAPKDIHNHFFEWRIVEGRHKTPAELKAWAGY